ncbi:MAG: hypothetical protein ABF370_20215 [Verrucomicrobiales bacterium]
MKPQVSEHTWQAFWITTIGDVDKNNATVTLGMERGPFMSQSLAVSLA